MDSLLHEGTNCTTERGGGEEEEEEEEGEEEEVYEIMQLKCLNFILVIAVGDIFFTYLF
jgi:hypothetical protein